MAISWRRLGRVMVESWLYRGPLLRTYVCLALLCHDTIYYIVTQHKLKMGSSPFQSLLLFSFLFFFFFFSHHFFFIAAIGKPPNFFFFSFSSKPNKFIKIYFIHFFPVLQTVNPKKKKNSSHHILFFLIKFWTICPKFLNLLRF